VIAAMAAAFDLNPVAQISATGMVDCLLAGTLIAAAAALGLRAARQASGVRFAVLFSSLIAIAALPFFATASWAHGTDLHLGVVAQPAEIIVPSAWALYLFAAWAVIAAAGLARVGAGLLQLMRLRRTCTQVASDSLSPQLLNTLNTHGAARAFTLCISDNVAVPTALGFLKPAVVIPAWLWHELSPAELNQIVLHELAHLRRLDDWTNLIQKTVKALFFFHPAVWWIEKKISLEREMACDDAVLAETANPRAYAECLAHLAERSFIRRSVVLAQAALGRVRQTSLRIAQILDGNRPAAKRHAWKPAVTVMAGFAVASAVWVARAPRLVAFEDSGSAVKLPAVSTGPATPAHSAELANALHPLDAVLPARSESSSPKARVVEAALRRPAVRSHRADYSTADLRGAQIAASMVHMASSKTDSVAATQAVYTQAVYVIVETSDFGPAGIASCQVTVWRFTVRRPSGTQISNNIPRKEA